MKVTLGMAAIIVFFSVTIAAVEHTIGRRNLLYCVLWLVAIVAVFAYALLL
jgi:hypothetical protein